MLVLNVFEKMFNHRRGNEKTGILQARHALESNTDDSILLNNRSAAVSGIDRGIRLASQQSAIA
jgi:hypothetical protein